MSPAKSLILLEELFILVLINFIQDWQGNSYIASFCNRFAYPVLGKLSKYDLIIITNKYLLGTYYVPGTVCGTWNMCKAHHLKVLPSTETPGADCSLAKVSFQWLTWISTSRSQQWQQAKLLKRELLILQLYFACHSLKDAYFEDLDYVEQRNRESPINWETERF